jgi:hypothetical protein
MLSSGLVQMITRSRFQRGEPRTTRDNSKGEGARHMAARRDERTAQARRLRAAYRETVKGWEEGAQPGRANSNASAITIHS